MDAVPTTACRAAVASTARDGRMDASTTQKNNQYIDVKSVYNQDKRTDVILGGILVRWKMKDGRSRGSPQPWQ